MVRADFDDEAGFEVRLRILYSYQNLTKPDIQKRIFRKWIDSRPENFPCLFNAFKISLTLRASNCC